MPALGETELKTELRTRRERLESALDTGGASARLEGLLEEVDAALERLEAGTYGLCDSCHESIEIERLLGDPLIRTCLDHLTEAERRALEQDLALASSIQSGLLPRRDLATAGWEVFYHYEPAGPVSGDYCDLVPAEDEAGPLFFLLGDVAGKGVAASMLMAGLRATVRTLLGTDLSVCDLLARANRLFCEGAAPSHYATLVCGKASRSGRIEIGNAGHCPPLLLRGREVLDISATGLPIGLFCGTEFGSTTVDLAPGDTLLLYTDGLSEARDRSGAEYGAERLSRLLAEGRAARPKALVAAILEDLAAFRPGAPRRDDLSLMAIQRSPGARI